VKMVCERPPAAFGGCPPRAEGENKGLTLQTSVSPSRGGDASEASQGVANRPSGFSVEQRRSAASILAVGNRPIWETLVRLLDFRPVVMNSVAAATIEVGVYRPSHT
jgi:hypothetical protein